MPTHYEVLRVRPSAGPDEIRQAWRKRIREAHPDKAGERATEIAQLINQAYDVLSDPIQRMNYDVELQAPHARSRSRSRERSRSPSPCRPPPPPPARGKRSGFSGAKRAAASYRMYTETPSASVYNNPVFGSAAGRARYG